MRTHKYVVYIKKYCKVCDEFHYLLFSKDSTGFIELEGKPTNIVIECEVGMDVNFKFKSKQKYRFSCDEYILIKFNNKGIFKGVK